MTNVQMIAIGIRLLGLWLLLNGLQTVLLSFRWLMLPSDGRFAVMVISIFWLALAAFMVAKPIFIVRQLAPRDDGASSAKAQPTWSIDDLEAALFSAVGMFVLVSALLDLEFWTRTWLAIAKNNQLWNVWNLLQIDQVILLALKCALGLLLMLRARALQAAIRKIRTWE